MNTVKEYASFDLSAKEPDRVFLFQDHRSVITIKRIVLLRPLDSTSWLNTVSKIRLAFSSHGTDSSSKTQIYDWLQDVKPNQLHPIFDVEIDLPHFNADNYSTQEKPEHHDKKLHIKLIADNADEILEVAAVRIFYTSFGKIS